MQRSFQSSSLSELIWHTPVSSASYPRGGLMSLPKNRMIFINRSFAHNERYWMLVKWFNDEPNFSWSNCGMPSHDALLDKTSHGLIKGMTRQIAPAQVALLSGGMYAAHSNWIEYEIGEAREINKTIIATRPPGQERIPLNVQNASIFDPAWWNRASVVDTVRHYS